MAFKSDLMEDTNSEEEQEGYEEVGRKRREQAREIGSGMERGSKGTSGAAQRSGGNGGKVS